MNIHDQIRRTASLLEDRAPDQWEIMAAAGSSLKIAVSGQEVDNFQQSQTEGLAIRLIKGGRLGFSYVQGGDEAALAQAVEEAWASAQASDLEDEAGFAASAQLPEVKEVFDPALEAEPLADKKERALTLARAAHEADSRVVHVHPAQISEASGQGWLLNSHGLDLHHKSTSFSATAMAVAAGGGGQEMGWEFEVRRFLADLDAARVGAEAGRRAAAFIGAEPVADGRYEVILEQQVAAEFLELLAASLLGDNVVKGRSLLAGRVGEKVMSEKISIIDDGLYPRGLGTAPFDDEGSPQTKTVLVDAGVAAGFVYDRLWASRQGLASTGNASRPSLKAPPGVGFKNLHITAGSHSPQDLISGLDRGLVISEVMGAHTADPVSGEFSLGASGFLIEGGKISRPVKSIAIAGQVVDLFSAVTAVGDDLTFFGSTGAPTILASGLSISGP